MNQSSSMDEIKTEIKEESGVVCEPELDNFLVKDEPMDGDEEMDESQENNLATPFISTVKEEQEPPNYEHSKSNMKVFPIPGGMLMPIPPEPKFSPNVTQTTMSEALVMFGVECPAGVYRYLFFF